MIATTLGHWALLLALVIAVYGVVASILGAKQRVPELAQSGRNAVVAVAALATIASGCLFYLLLTRNYQVDYVWQTVDNSLSTGYVVAAFYAGKEGSLLLWLWLVAVFGAIAVLRKRDWNEELLPYVGAVVAGVSAFFVVLLVSVDSPFRLLPQNPGDGLGMLPILRNPWMISHPPILFIGYAAYTIPFAYAIAALATGRVGSGWVRGIRLWSLFAWLFLGVGILLGAVWAYGSWNRYWGWDPVENSSLIPWLVGTAFLHSVMMQERRGMFKRWNIALATLTFALCIFATFVIRGGFLSSPLHGFGDKPTPQGYLLLAFLAIVLGITFVLVILRRKELTSRRQMESFLSREFGLLVTILALGGIAFAIFLGLVFPALGGQAAQEGQVLTSPYYARVFNPLATAVIIVIAICPVLAWGRSSSQRVLQAMLWPAVMAVVFGVALTVAGIRPLYAVLGFALCVFVLTSILVEFGRGWLARKRMTGESYPVAFFRLLNKNHRRYGGYLVHLGVVIMAAGVIGSSVYQSPVEGFYLRPGESVQFQGYTIQYRDYSIRTSDDELHLAVAVDVSKGGRYLGVLTPEASYYWKYSQPASVKQAIRADLVEDLHVILPNVWSESDPGFSLQENGEAILQVRTLAMVTWLWIGGGLLLLGTLWAMWPRPEKARSVGRAE